MALGFAEGCQGCPTQIPREKLEHPHRHDGCGLGSEDPGSQTHPLETALVKMLKLLIAPPSLGPHSGQRRGGAAKGFTAQNNGGGWAPGIQNKSVEREFALQECG